MSQTTTNHHPATEMQQAIENCASCRAICEQTLSYCLKKGGKHAEPSHLQLLRDCLEICVASSGFMLRDSAFHHLTCGACAEICARCAESCEKMPNDAQMKACAEACRRCAESCGKMSTKRA